MIQEQEDSSRTSKILSECYVSLQGEGIRAGRPSIIARFQKCNLKCRWCDTPSLPPAFTIDKFLDMIKEHPYFDVIITGGEPLLYQDEVLQMIHDARHSDYEGWITIETNSTIIPNAELIRRTRNNVLWTLSPKLSSSGERFDIDTLLEFMDLVLDAKLNAQIKVVVSNYDGRDLVDLRRILKAVPHHIPVTLQPVSNENDTLQSYSTRCSWLAEKVINEYNNHRDIRLGIQLHKMLWGFDRKQI